MASPMNELLNNGSRKKRGKSIGIGLLILTPFLIAWLLPPEVIHSEYSICVFKTVVNKPCPFCGLTRAYVHAAHGDFESAHRYHPFWWIAALIMVVAAASSLFDGIFGTNTLKFLTRLVSKYAWAIIIIIAAFGVYRLIHPM